MIHFYAVLDMPPGSTDVELKAAYRELALKHHPDRGGDSSIFAEITCAASVLCDRGKRNDYDKLLRLLLNPCASCQGTGQQRVQVSFKVVNLLPCGACYGKGYYERV